MRRLTAAALAAVVAVMLVACGEDGGRSGVAAPASFFGVAPQDATSDVDLARMAAGGIGSYHLLLSWARVETAPGVYDWSGYDELLSKLATFGIEPVAYAFGTPGHWADEQSVPPTTDPAALRAWERFLAAAAKRYAPGGELWRRLAESDPDLEPRPLRVWEIWNEPNSSTFWSPQPSPEDYGTLLRRSERALHEVDPAARIMTAGMFATPGSDEAITSFDFLARLFAERGIAEAVGLVGIHPYGPRIADVRAQIERTREVVDDSGDPGAGLWVTEIGWGSDPGARSQLAKTPARQATLLRRAYELMISKRGDWDLKGALWYTWRDFPGRIPLCGWCASAGLLDSDLDPKPAWREYTSLTGGEPVP